MKKLILPLIAILSFTSCETKYCWKCTISTQATTGNYSAQSTTTVCEKSKSEIEDYERAGTSQTTANGVTVVTTTNCTVND